MEPGSSTVQDFNSWFLDYLVLWQESRSRIFQESGHKTFKWLNSLWSSGLWHLGSPSHSVVDEFQVQVFLRESFVTIVRGGVVVLSNCYSVPQIECYFTATCTHSFIGEFLPPWLFGWVITRDYLMNSSRGFINSNTVYLALRLLDFYYKTCNLSIL